MKIRRATAADAAAIDGVSRACFSDPWRLETLRQDMERPHSLYLVAEEGREILGYGCYWFVADEAQLVNIGVRPERRRRGVAEHLVAAGIGAAQRRGMATMFLEVRVSNIAAQGLYRKYGFSVISLRKEVYDLPREDGYIMARTLVRNEA